ncbi:MAG: FtsX-like permease family protein [Candidatus Limousia pullorum]|nr:FtsX-like permease family protein [Candidatus Limousia pullorum]
MFITISLLILGIGILISIILLVKQQNTRFREIGLLSALGYKRKLINRLLLEEGLLICGITAVFGDVLSSLVIFIGKIFGVSLLLFLLFRC